MADSTAHESYKFVLRPTGVTMLLTAPWSSEARNAFRSRNATGLEIFASGYFPRDLEFLQELSELHHLRILVPSELDEGVVCSLTSLHSLELDTFSRTPIDLGGFPQLTTLVAGWSPRLHGLSKCRHLRRLTLRQYKPRTRDLVEFHDLKKLCFLGLIQGAVADLGGLGHPESIRHLELFRLRNLKSLTGIESLLHLRTLCLEGMRSIGDLRPLGALREVERLWLTNMGRIQSLAPLRNLRGLKDLSLFEDTTVVDGNLSVLDGFSGLKAVAFRDRRHYNRKCNEFPMDVEYFVEDPCARDE